MKRVLSVQDISCVGKCSVTVTAPVLSAMGCTCSLLPTAVLSTHTGFPSPYIKSLTRDMMPICNHWQEQGVTFDAVSVGYLADTEQVEKVEAVLDCFPCFTVIDPAMADNGKLYHGMTTEQVTALSHLCRRGDLLLPNATEAALLTGIPYQETTDLGYYEALLAGMLDFGTDGVVITGVSLADKQLGYLGYHKDTGKFSYQVNALQGHYHGTGDLFSAVTVGSLMAGNALQDAAGLAAGFIERTIRATGKPNPFGVSFESQLPWLWEQL